jgi:hypothetical protein
MAKLTLKIRQDIEVNKIDSVLEVLGSDGKLGDLAFSKGGVDWWPTDSKVNCQSFTWVQLAVLLTANGTKKRKAKPK